MPKKNTRANSQRGFFIIESLAGVAMILLAFAGVGTSLRYMYVANHKMQIVQNFVETENRLVSALSNVESYSTTVRTQMANGAIPTYTIPMAAGDSGGVIQIATNGSTFVSKSGMACSGFSDADCWYEVQVNVGRSPTNFALGYDYKILTNPALEVQLPDSDRSLLRAANGDGFQLKIPSDVMKLQVSNDCSTNALMRGMSRDSGQVECLQLPSAIDTCPSGTLARGLTIRDGRMVLDCSSPQPTVTCPANYALKSVDTPQMAQGNRVGNCQWVARDTASAGSFTGGSIGGTACPPHYHVANRCTIAYVTPTNGYCQKTCHYSYEVCGADTCSGNPAVCTPNCWTETASYNCSYSIPANTGVTLSDMTNVGNGNRYVLCHVVIPDQPDCPGDCDSCTRPSVTSAANFVGNCVIDSTIPQERAAE